MSYETFIALRYLASSRKRAHVALISTISVLGLAVGVAALIISLALLSGFQDRIRTQMAERSAHLVVSPVRGDRLPDSEAVRRALAALPGVLSVEPAIEGRGWLSDASGRATLPIRFRNLPKESERTVAGDTKVPSGRLSSTAASRLDVTVGSLVRVLSSRTRLSPIGPIPIEILVRVASIRRGSALEKSPDLEISESTARLLTGMASGSRAYEARLADPDRAEIAARKVAGTLGPAYRVQTWRDLNAPLALALRLEKVVIFATVALVIFLAALNIVLNLALMVGRKKRDLGVPNALRAPPGAPHRISLL